MRVTYSLLFYLAMPVVLSHMALRSLKDRRWRLRWAERFGVHATRPAGGGIIVHAASVGEVNAAVPLIRALLERQPAETLTVTTFTPTGSQRVIELFGNRVFHVYAPLDLPGSVARFLRSLRPRLVIIMETEIWPNLYHAAGRAGIPILLANARLSDHSLRTYLRFRRLTGGALRQVSHAAAQSQADAERLVACGLPGDRVSVGGNLKFDHAPLADLASEAHALRAHWGAARPVLIAASTHREDDVVVIEAFRLVRESLPGALLILVPRHPERFAAAAELATRKGFITELFSAGAACSPTAECFVIDAMGELPRYYACSDVAFIGGSFGAVGGHNPLEASALGLPVIVGPDMSNFREITAQLEQAGAALRVFDASALARQAADLMTDPRRRQTMGSAGQTLVQAGQGALAHTLTAIEDLLNRVPG
jgi:3-deoxy-D-manno-octulosonic-acid transferase